MNKLFVLFLLLIPAMMYSFISPCYKSRKMSQSFLTLKMIRIALTREKGTNEKLANLLPKFECLELPCIMFAPGADSEKLGDEITKHDIITITSPQGAAVLLETWIRIGRPDIKVAAVGKGTAKPLISEGLKPVFEPSDFTAVTLAAELPDKYGDRVLYPTSTLADGKLQLGLEKRGFMVTRLNTYETVPSVWTEEMIEIAKSVDIVTFASPSAVRIWKERVGTSATAVVIGPTSARAAEKAGFEKVVCPDGSKGLEIWAMLIADTAKSLAKLL